MNFPFETIAAQATLQYDSSRVELRTIPAKSLRQYRLQQSFQYQPLQPVSESIVDRLLRRIFRSRLNQELASDGLLVLAFLIFLFAVFKITGMDFAKLFGRDSKQPKVSAVTGQQDPLPEDPERAIAEAAEKRFFRVGVRLMFLQVLQKLDNCGLIILKQYKTNHTYCMELDKTGLYTDFSALCSQFEWAWYGDSPIDELQFSRIREEYLRLMEQIR